ncbi:hypothetical protein B296_00050618 [Ensete ventricosum]|uniref:Chaperone DnaJ C-terminal domain-containing protein n=1 Tax=Ensete ventricosum TaxID=4639 RepID=A0A426XY61_ENSVE|nr:hypothetical protein B296_00050618 [Ensete ventricosum]
MPVEEILTIDIKPGWKKGTKITFEEKGNERPNVIPADVVFVIDEKPHPVFTREGNDLVTTKKISLAEALTGYTAHLTTLDGRSLIVPVDSVIHPGYEEVVPKEGMPLPKDPSRKGNLRIKFDVKFPTRLTSEQKAEYLLALTWHLPLVTVDGPCLSTYRRARPPKDGIHVLRRPLHLPLEAPSYASWRLRAPYAPDVTRCHVLRGYGDTCASLRLQGAPKTQPSPTCDRLP